MYTTVLLMRCWREQDRYNEDQTSSRFFEPATFQNRNKKEAKMTCATVVTTLDLFNRRESLGVATSLERELFTLVYKWWS